MKCRHMQGKPKLSICLLDQQVDSCQFPNFPQHCDCFEEEKGERFYQKIRQTIIELKLKRRMRILLNEHKANKGGKE